MGRALINRDRFSNRHFTPKSDRSADIPDGRNVPRSEVSALLGAPEIGIPLCRWLPTHCAEL
jgi:hypothetical protein